MLNCQGHAYNTFPKMGDNWIPDDIFSMEPFIRNFFENTSTVQVLFHTYILGIYINICLVKQGTGKKKFIMGREEVVGTENISKNVEEILKEKIVLYFFFKPLLLA